MNVAELTAIVVGGVLRPKLSFNRTLVVVALRRRPSSPVNLPLLGVFLAYAVCTASD